MQYLEHEVRRCARLDCLSEDAIVVRVDERLVQVEHHHLPPNQTLKGEREDLSVKAGDDAFTGLRPGCSQGSAKLLLLDGHSVERDPAPLIGQ